MRPQVARRRTTYVEDPHERVSGSFFCLRLEPFYTSADVGQAAWVSAGHLLFTGLFMAFACVLPGSLRDAVLLYVPALLLIGARFLALVTRWPYWLIVGLGLVYVWQSVPELFWPDSPYARNWALISFIFIAPWALPLLASLSVRESLLYTCAVGAVALAAVGAENLPPEPHTSLPVCALALGLLLLCSGLLVRSWAGRQAADLQLSAPAVAALVELSTSPVQHAMASRFVTSAAGIGRRTACLLGSGCGLFVAALLLELWPARAPDASRGVIAGLALTGCGGWILLGSLALGSWKPTFPFHAVRGLWTATVVWWTDHHPVPTAPGVYTSRQFDWGPFAVRRYVTFAAVAGCTAVCILRDPALGLEQFQDVLFGGTLWRKVWLAFSTSVQGAVLAIADTLLITGPWFAYIRSLHDLSAAERPPVTPE